MTYTNQALGSDLSGHDTTFMMDYAPQAMVDVAHLARHYPVPHEPQLLNDQCFYEAYDSRTVAHEGVYTALAQMGNQVTPH